MAAVIIDAALGTANAASSLPTSFTVTLASGTGTPGVGDLVMIVVTTRGTGGAVNTPSGWTALSGSPFSNATSGVNRMYVFYRIRQAGDSNSVAFTATSGGANETFLAQAYYFGGIDDVTPIEVAAVATSSSATSATLAGPLTGATSLGNDALAVAIWHRADDAGTFSTASSGWTHNSDANAVVASTLGTDASMGVATKRLGTPSASGTYQVDVAGGAAAHWIGIVVILGNQSGGGLATVTAEAWADEATITAQGTNDPLISIISGAGTTKADDAWSYEGRKSYRHDVTATQQRFKINCVKPDNIQYGAFIFRSSQWPSASTRVASLEGYSGPDHCQVQYQADGGWRIAGNGGSPFSSLSSTKTPVNTPVRIEWTFNGNLGTAELRIFQGVDIDNDVANWTEQITLSGLTNGVVGRGMFGPGVANFSSASIWYDLASVRRTSWVNLSGPSMPPEFPRRLRSLLVR